MDEATLKAQLTELEETIEGFFNRKSEKDSKEDLDRYRKETLQGIAEMGELLQQHPFYGAIGFLGKFQFVECPEIEKLREGSSEALLEEIRGAAALKVADSARVAWDHLLATSKETLCTIVALCYLARRNGTILKRL